jgi:hypothetical protein
VIRRGARSPLKRAGVGFAECVCRQPPSRKEVVAPGIEACLETTCEVLNAREVVVEQDPNRDGKIRRPLLAQCGDKSNVLSRARVRWEPVALTGEGRLLATFWPGFAMLARCRNASATPR